MEVLRKHLLREGRLNKKEMMEIITGATNIMSKYPERGECVDQHF